MQGLFELFGLDSNPSASTFEEVISWLPKPVARPRRLLLLADVHANWHALTSVLHHAQGRYDTIWFLGDIVGYGPRPLECVRFLKCVSPQRWRVGNHDLGVLGRLGKFVHGYSPSENARWTWKRHAQQLHTSPFLWRWFKRAVSDKRVQPVTRRYGAYAQVFVHASLQDPVGRYLYPDDWGNTLTNLRMLEEYAGRRGSGAWLVVGHTHMVCLARLKMGDTIPELVPICYGESTAIRDGLYLINPGSVGQPRDGDRRAAYAILDTIQGDVEIHRVEYDILSVQREMQRQGYPDDLVECLWTARIRDTQHFERVYEHMEGGLVPRNTG